MKTHDVEFAVATLISYRKHVIVPNVSWGLGLQHECDLVVYNPATGFMYEVEIKVSVSDFRADFKKKHKHEDQYLRKLVYAMPATIYEKVKDEIPEACGIITVRKVDGYGGPNERHGNPRAKWVRTGKLNKSAEKLTPAMVAKLYHLAAMRIWKLKEHVHKLREKSK